MTIEQINKRFAHCLAISPYAIFIQASLSSEMCVNHQCPHARGCRYFSAEQEGEGCIIPGETPEPASTAKSTV